MKKLAALLAVALMAAPTLSHAAMAGSNTVNSAAIVDGAVATADLAGKAVTAAKIADATITATQLAAGAVTDAKISGTISSTKLPIGTTGSSVAAGNHTHDTAYAKKAANVVVVAKSGGDYTSPVTALAAITSASATNPYLVKVMPGVYDLGTTSLRLKDFVSIEGSGDSSIITSSANTSSESTEVYCDGGTVIMANNSSLRNITIINKGFTVYSAVGVSLRDVTAVLDGVTVKVEPGSDNGDERNAVCIAGPATNAFITNSNLISYSGTGESSPIELVRNSKVVVTNSRLLASSQSGHAYGIDCNHDQEGMNADAELTLFNSLLDVIVTGSGSGTAYYGKACKNTNITNIIVTGTGGDSMLGIDTDKQTIVKNSQFYLKRGTADPASVLDWSPGFGKTISISNSTLQGTISDLTNVKLSYNVDENGAPIPNQPSTTNP